MTQTPNPTKLNELLASRQIDQEFLSGLVVLEDYVAKYGEESKCPPTPGFITRNPGDPRINVSPSEMIVMCRSLAKISHRPSGRVFLVYRDTIDAQHMESQDLIKYPKWLMDDPRKQNERSIRINEMTRGPKDAYDSDWITGNLDDKTYDTLAYFVYLISRKDAK